MADNGPNPYLPPSLENDRDVAGALDSCLKTRDHVAFSTDITPADLLDALDAKSFRRDLQRLRRMRSWVLPPVFLIVLIELAQGLGVARRNWGVLVMLGGLLGLLGMTAWMHWRLRRKSVGINQSLLGQMHGRLDRDGLWIESENASRYRPMDQLVGAAMTKNSLVLCFDRAYAMFETIPFRAFEDVDTAMVIGKQLVEACPFQAPEPMDSRRMEPMDGEAKFQPGPDAVYYSGEVLLSEMAGTRLDRGQRWARFWGWLQTLVILFAAAAFVWLISPSQWLAIAATCVLGFVFLRSSIRILRVPFIGQADHGVMFFSSGWVDSNGVVSLSRISQSLARWEVFERVEFSDQMIALKSKDADLWNLISIGQFKNEVDWKAAREFVEHSMKRR